MKTGGDAATGANTGTDRDAGTLDVMADGPVLNQFGYAVVGANVNPPLLHRVKALACQPCAKNGRPKQRPDLVALIPRPKNDPAAPASALKAKR